MTPFSTYQAPWWLPDGHSQTIYPAVFGKRPAVTYRRERWHTPDNDFIDFDWVDPLASSTTSPTAPQVVLFHGLEGSSNSHYCRSLMALVAARGWVGVVPHFRGCSEEINLTPRFYHSGDSDEIALILRRIQQSAPQRPLLVAGVSLGGNALLRYMGEHAASSTYIQAAAAISAPIDLTSAGFHIGRPGVNVLYTKMFMHTLRRKALHKLTMYPDLYSREAVLQARNLYEFDNVVTAPLHGFRNTEDYWHRASSLHNLPNIRVPSLILNALNDPFMPASSLPTKAQISPAITLEQPAQGGHVGFLQGGAVPFHQTRLDWLPQRILAHFDAYL